MNSLNKKTMKTLSTSILTSALWVAGVLAAAAQEPADYVNPFIGGAANGHTFPGACTPFGLVQSSPVTGAVGWQYCAEYLHSDARVWGFTQTHLNGTGCMDLGDVLVMPSTARDQRTDYRSLMDKQSEKASPGYYSVELTETGVKAELTATPHVAFHRYTFHRADSAALYVDLQHGPVWNESMYRSHVKACEVKWLNGQMLSGHVQTSVWVNQDLYFVMTFSHPVKRVDNLPLQATERGNRMLVYFDLKPGEQLGVKIAISSASVEGAAQNLQAECKHWDFDAATRQARNAWNHLLGRIEAKGSQEELTNFYTAFYHTLIQPNNIADVDGTYRNAKGQPATAEGGTFYSTFSTWDTYRAAHPFYTLAVPEMVDPFVRSLVSQAEVQGHLPIWTLWGKENYCMIGNHSVSIVAEAYEKGFRGFDAERAFAAVKRTQTVSHKMKSDWEKYMRYGYFPCDSVTSESVSSTLESVYDDYAAACMARRMGKKEDAAYFTRRAAFYKNLFDPSTRFMRPKLSNGAWKTPFNPSDLAHAESVGGDYTEGNAWQYTWHVQHDVPGLIALMGGKKAFCQKLDSLFTVKMKGQSLADVTGLIGQYAHGNEPSHHVAYLYALAGKPERTQELVREIVSTQYHPTPEGLCGNDDCGQMSAWYILSCMGFYPVDPVSANYVFGAPQLPRISLSLPGGKRFTVVAEGLSEPNKYVKAIYLNGKRYRKNYISHADIVKGGELRFVMTAERPSN